MKRPRTWRDLYENTWIIWASRLSRSNVFQVTLMKLSLHPWPGGWARDRHIWPCQLSSCSPCMLLSDSLCHMTCCLPQYHKFLCWHGSFQHFPTSTTWTSLGWHSLWHMNSVFKGKQCFDHFDFLELPRLGNHAVMFCVYLSGTRGKKSSIYWQQIKCVCWWQTVSHLPKLPNPLCCAHVRLFRETDDICYHAK